MIKFRLSTKDITQIGMFTALTTIGGFITIPIGPVPITLQSFFVLLSGIILGAKKSLLTQITYIMLGLSGLPIFSGFSGGVQAVIKPSFGFLIGFIVVAYLVGKISEKDKSTKKLFIAVVIGTIILYMIGIPYMYYILNIILGKNLSFIQILNMGMILFIPGDALKAVLAVFVGKKIYSRL